MASASAALARAANLGVGQFYGAIGPRRAEGGLVLTELRHSRAVALPAHDHQCPGIYLWLEGRYQEWVGAGPVEYGPHTAVFHPAALRHRDAIGPGGARLFAIELHGALLERVGALLPRVPVRDVGGRIAALATRLHHELPAEDPAAALAREGLAYELVAALARHGREEVAPWLRRADEALRGELDRRWSLAELARAADVHPTRLVRGFRRCFGESVGERLRRLRLDAARERLARPGSDLAEVAAACGFSDQSHMTRAFRAAFGTTPGEFRRQARTRRSLALC